MIKVKTILFSLLILNIITNLSAQSEDKLSIAVLALQGKGITVSEASILTDELRSILVQTEKYNVLERDNMESILKEQGFQLSGCTSTACAIEAGKLLDVQKMVAGSVGKIGTLYNINILTIDVETGKIDKAVSKRHDGSIEQLLDAVKHVGYELSDTDIVETPQDKDELISSHKQEKQVESRKSLINEKKVIVKVGMTSTTTTQHSGANFGFVAGMGYRFHFIEGLYIQPEFLYSSRAFEYYEPEEVISYEDLQLAALLSYTVPFLQKNFLLLNVNAGLAFNYLLGAQKEAYDETYDLTKYDDGQSAVENYEMALILGPGLGFDLEKFIILIDVRYEIGLTSIFKNDDSWDVGKNRVLSFMGGISF